MIQNTNTSNTANRCELCKELVYAHEDKIGILESNIEYSRIIEVYHKACWNKVKDCWMKIKKGNK